MNQRTSFRLIVALATAAVWGCAGGEAPVELDQSVPKAASVVPENPPMMVVAESPTDADNEVAKETAAPAAPEPSAPAVVVGDVKQPAAEPPTMDEILSNLQVPPPWLDSVDLDFDTTLPWNKAWDRIEVLLGTADPINRQRAVKLAYLYQEEGRARIGYPATVYFLSGEYAWAIREFATLNEKNSATHMRMASCYLHFNQYELALASLEQAEQQITETPPWDTFRRGQVLEAKGDIYADRGDVDPARENYRSAHSCYQQTALPANQQLVKNRSVVNLQSKLELLDHRELLNAPLADGEFSGSVPGYSNTIRARVTVAQGNIAKIDIEHSEKADLQSTRIIPEQIKAKQNLHVDAISGATVTSQAVRHAVFQALKQAAGIE